MRLRLAPVPIIEGILMTVTLFSENHAWLLDSMAVVPTECAANNGALEVGTCSSPAECDHDGGVPSGKCSSGGVCCISEYNKIMIKISAEIFFVLIMLSTNFA